MKFPTHQIMLFCHNRLPLKNWPGNDCEKVCKSCVSLISGPVNPNMTDFSGYFALFVFFALAFESGTSTNNLLIKLLNLPLEMLVCKTVCKKRLFLHFHCACTALKTQAVVKGLGFCDRKVTNQEIPGVFITLGLVLAASGICLSSVLACLGAP